MTAAAPLSERIGAVMVQDTDGRPVRLDSAWRDRPALLLFIRHFG